MKIKRSLQEAPFMAHAETFPTWPHHDPDEIEAAQAVLESGRVNYWTGSEGRVFEAEFAAYHQVPHALSVANGTVALELALEALGVGPGDEVIVPARTFIATASAVVKCGAIPVVVDVEADSQAVAPDAAEAAITPRTRALIAVHLGGSPANVHALSALCKAHDLFFIEDCAQAHGAKIDGSPVGQFGDAGCFSFCQDKIITTGGEGGMITLKDSDLFEKIWSLRDHGKNRGQSIAPSDGAAFRYVVDDFGTNGRMTEMQSAIGRRQLKKLDDWVSRRAANAAILTSAFEGIAAMRVPIPPAGVQHAYYRHYSFFDGDAFKSEWSRDRVVSDLRSAGVPAMSGACPDIAGEKAFARHNINTDHPRPIARALGNSSFALPVHPTLGAADMERMADRAIDVIKSALR